MHSAHATLLVDNEPGWPGFNAIRTPDCVVVISDYRILDAEHGNFVSHVIDIALALELGRVHAYDRQSFIAIACVPTLHRRQSVATVVTTERPEIDNDDASAQTLQRQRIGIDPGAAG